MLFLVARSPLAQEKHPLSPPASSYDGQSIVSVDVVGRQNVELQNLRNLIPMRPGEVYTSSKAQAAVQNLKQTGRFDKVDFDVKPAPGGVRVTFIVQPVYYLGLVSFPEIGKQFSYTRLLQLVDLPGEERFDESRIPASETALRDFLRTQGYFQAHVRAEIQFDDPHQLANPIFHVTTGKRARYGQIAVTGPPPPERARLERALRSWRARFHGAVLKKGKSYNPQHVDNATAFLHDTLGRGKRLANQIKRVIEFDPENNRANVSFQVTEGPLVSIRIVGAKLSLIPFLNSRNQKRLIPIYEERSFDRDLVLEGKRNLINFFQTKGYFDVKVEEETHQTADRIDLSYHINTGQKHKLENIDFAGNTHFDEDELAKHIEIKKGHFLSKTRFSEQLLGKSEKDLAGFYRDQGYEKAEVHAKVVDYEPEVDVTFQIVEGPQTVVQDVRLEGNQALPRLDSLVQLTLRPGQPYSVNAMTKDRDHILAAYLERGYLMAQLKALVERPKEDSQHVNVVYQIQEGPQVHTQEVVLLGQKHTQQAFMARVTDVHPEDVVSQSKMLEAQSKLYNLQIFDWVSVGPRRAIEGQTQEDLLVMVHEAKRNSITFGFGFEYARRAGNVPSGTVVLPNLPAIGLGGIRTVPSDSAFLSPRGTVEFTRRNMRGRAETATFAALLSRLDQRGLFSYADPHFRGTNWNSLLSASIERTTENPIYTARLANGSFQIERALNPDHTRTLQLRYNFRRTVLTNLVFPQLVEPQDRSVRLSTVSGTLIRDTRDKPLDAHRGFYQTLDLEISPKVIGSNSNFARLFGQVAYYKPLFGSLVWANSVRLGLAKPFAGSRVPLSERFFSGGATSLRGFPINGAGPQRSVEVCSNPANKSTCELIRVPVGGNQLFILNSELRFPLPIKKGLGGVLFYDGGNVYDKINFNDFKNHYTNTVGFGLRYETPIGPVRIDLGHNLNPIPGVKSTQYFITLGQAF